jgi:hypothetical protein
MTILWDDNVVRNCFSFRLDVLFLILFMKSIFTFFLDEKSNKKIKPQYFYTKNHRTDFPIATPAARVSHSTPGSLPTASAQILTVILWYGNYKDDKRTFL